jgi:hypothetical protein
VSHRNILGMPKRAVVVEDEEVEVEEEEEERGAQKDDGDREDV